MRFLAMLGRLAGLALVGVFVWNLVRRRRRTEGYAGHYDAPYVMKRVRAISRPWSRDVVMALRDTAARASTVFDPGLRAAKRVPRLISKTDEEAPADLDVGSVEFEWLVRVSPPARVAQALEAAGIAFESADPAVDDREDDVVERLEAVGMHLDEEGAGVAMRPVARYIGSASPRRVATAFEQALKEAHTGFIVDATQHGRLFIDEHQTVGSGVLALLEPSQARLTHGESTRAFLRAARSAAGL